MADSTPNTDTRVAVDSQSTALTRPVMGLPTPTELDIIERLGQTYHQSGLLPSGVRNWQAAVIAIQAGRELGIPPTVAVREIYVVNGRPTCSAQLMMSLIRRAYGPGAIRVKEATPTGCTIEYREPGWDGVGSFTFNLDDAKRAGLAGGKNDNWNKYPRAMYRSRAVSEVARMVFPDAILGMYTPDEMGAPVDEEGRIVVTGTVVDVGTGEVLESEDDLAMKRLHAVANDAGVTHPQLHAWAVENFAVASLKDLDYRKLNGLSRTLQDADKAAQFREKYAVRSDANEVQDEPIEAEYTEVEAEPAEPGQTVMLTDDDYAEIDAMHAAEKAERARR